MLAGLDIDPRGVATVTIRNAAKLNTLNSAVLRALIAALEQAGADEQLRAVVLTGEGERAFIGGADITEMANLEADTARGFISLIHRCCDTLRALPVPVVARIRGHALGAGLEIAAACDLRVAATDARFAMPEVRIGIPSVVEAALLPHLIGWGRTRRLLLTGEAIDAGTAEAWGLVEAVAAPEALDQAVEAMLSGILASGRHAVRIQKALIRRWEDSTATEAIEAGIDAFASAWETDEPRVMMRDFLAYLRARRAGR